jgi:hypothetical protein
MYHHYQQQKLNATFQEDYLSASLYELMIKDNMPITSESGLSDLQGIWCMQINFT